MILGINNRTENWKTARYFAPFFTCDSTRANFAQRLAEPKRIPGGKVQIELFWKGVRDYINRPDVATSHDFADCYKRLFSDLRRRIKEFNSCQPSNRGLRLPNPWNYDVCAEGGVEKLYNNLRNTEIDIVLESPNHLFIGEAKGETTLRGNGDLVLVHQLIRQYVVAKILVDHRVAEGYPEKRIISFVVGHKTRLPSLKNTAQVKFMIDEGWLKEKNILSWNQIKELAQAGV